VDETITVEEQKDTQIKPSEVAERLEATPAEQSSIKTPSPQPSSSDIHVLTIAAEAGGSARYILAGIRSKRGTCRDLFSKISVEYMQDVTEILGPD